MSVSPGEQVCDSEGQGQGGRELEETQAGSVPVRCPLLGALGSLTAAGGVSTYSFEALHLKHIQVPLRPPPCPVEMETIALYGAQHLLGEFLSVLRLMWLR